jgi:hypothetical protein
MRLFRHKGRETTTTDFFADRAAKEGDMLDAIGAKTDPLADETLRLVDQLPDNERQLFMKNVLRQLVAQTLLVAESFDDQHIKTLGYGIHHRLGNVHSYAVLNHDELARAIIDNTLPRFEQERLDLDTHPV